MAQRQRAPPIEDSPPSFLPILLPRVPFLLTTALRHSISWSPTASKWDLRTELTINTLRDLLKDKQPVGAQQKRSMHNVRVRGRMWVADVVMPRPGDEKGGLRDEVVRAVEEMKKGGDRFDAAEVAEVEAEWTGYRKDAAKDELLPDVSEEEKYKRMMSEVKSDTTILYFHGGALYLCDPCSHRPLTSLLAKLTTGRVLSVRYRLAPQYPFPSGLLDCLHAYLYLLHPPPGSFHEPVPASKIVFGGDSAGGNLSFTLLQLLLQLHRTAPSGQQPTIRFHGRDVPVPLPAGVTANSGWFDVTRSFPSLQKNAKWDYLPPPSDSAHKRFPHDDVWPTNPPRGDLYCDASMLCHPLVSPVASRSWEGSPPMFFCAGEEMLLDEIKLLASRAASQGVKVKFEGFEAMPHVFAMMTPGSANAKRCMGDWAEFCRTVAEKGAEGVESEALWIDVKGKEEKLALEGFSEVTWEQGLEFMRKAKERRESGGEREGKTQPML